ncbi:3-hydroxyacyl-CoA dehydrogenase family protein [Salicibibacter halophilus]|uniref:3-hydroxyacyl-CoA dehydrogenase family protein n=1 Tax=Salicibibacter halophilus TaxID=2502791 RepID=A0A514LEN0_9BACI|nr:3-hydroxyacyl-CoA dehydrogenase family protein [Salicibibacter halophilus]QDI90313.1 3-hydroxyacyl-CoA dehydrogenase family protein [Salicibibacter halophilus]
MVQNVAVIGAGKMGSQIAAVCALAGFHVNIHDRHEETFSKNMEEISKQLHHTVEKGELAWRDLEHSFAHLVFEPELESAVKDRDFVIESTIEDLPAKRNILKNIDEHAPKHAIFATNSSAIVHSKIADAIDRPAQVCSFHFFKAAKIVQGTHTSDETVETAMDVARRMNKTSMLLKQENHMRMDQRVIV